MKKLSQLNTDEALDIFCTITPSVNSIMSDAGLIAELRKSISEEDMKNQGAMMAAAVRKINHLTPILLKQHRADIANILAALGSKTPEEILRQPLLMTMKQIRDVVKDKELVSFFVSCTSAEGNE